MHIPNHLSEIHQKALSLACSYKKTEADLLDCIIQVRENKIYRFFDCSSIFEYCVKILKLDPGVVYGFTAVAKKIKEIPELKEKITEGSLNVSVAKRITSVLTQANKEEWFTKASTLPIRKLEKEVAKENPKEEVKEKASYLRSERIKLELGLSEELMLRLRRIQDLESQKNKRSTSLEEVLEVMAHEYLNKNDPLKKAQRAKVRGKLQSNQKIKEEILVKPQNIKPDQTQVKTQLLEQTQDLPPIQKQDQALGQAIDRSHFNEVTTDKQIQDQTINKTIEQIKSHKTHQTQCFPFQVPLFSNQSLNQTKTRITKCHFTKAEHMT